MNNRQNQLSPPDMEIVGDHDRKERFLLMRLAGRYEQEMIRYLVNKGMNLSFEDKLLLTLVLLLIRAGHVCAPAGYSFSKLGRLLDLEDDLLRALPDQIPNIGTSEITGGPEADLPLVLHKKKLYLNHYFKMERRVKKWITAKADEQNTKVNPATLKQGKKMFAPVGTGDEMNWQQAAAALSFLTSFLIISGGPGTGKTTTVARLLVMHQRSIVKPMRIALAAPTGKAAGRMGEALRQEMKKLDLEDKEMTHYPTEASTIHRLLRSVEHKGLLPPAEESKLPYDLIIIDEASMIDLSLIDRLVRHVGAGTRLILLGDKDQLASVEAGSVFADLCEKDENGFLPETREKLNEMGVAIGKNYSNENLSRTANSIVYLTKSYRFDEKSGIGTLAYAVNRGLVSENEAIELFEIYSDINHHSFSYSNRDLSELADQNLQRLKNAGTIEDPEGLMEYWKENIWLTVLRNGLSGSDSLNRMVERSLAAKPFTAIKRGWYHGRPIIINKNDYDLEVFNGDFGVCVSTGKEDHPFYVYIQSAGGLKRVRPEQLQHYSQAYFLTVHKSQGSEFENVNLLLPGRDVPILTRELLYTAITRARTSFSLYGDIHLFTTKSRVKTERFSGLQDGND
ncbi:MAG: exodeoxyribonuclease V subunit alpha [Bacteroidota bacterium]